MLSENLGGYWLELYLTYENLVSACERAHFQPDPSNDILQACEKPVLKDCQYERLRPAR